MVYKIFDKKTGSGTTNKTEVNVNEVLGHKLDKTMIKKIQNKKSLCQVLR